MRFPKLRHHPLRNLAFVQYRNKRYYLGPWKSEIAADAYRDFLAQVFSAKPDRQQPSAKTIAGIVKLYLDDVALNHGIGPRGRYAAAKLAMKSLTADYAAEPVESFGPLKLKRLQKKLATERVTRRYVNATIKQIKRMFRWAATEELIPGGSWHSLSSLSNLKAGESKARESPQRLPATDAQIAATEKFLTPMVRTMVQFQRLTGARSGSVVLAKPSQFDRTENIWLWRPPHKTQHLGHELVVPVGPKAQAAIEHLLKACQPDDYLFTPRKTAANKRYRPRYTPGTYGKSVQNAAKKAGVAHWSPHQLRHARGHEIRKGYGVEAVQACLGHRSVSMAEHYSDQRTDLAIKVARETG